MSNSLNMATEREFEAEKTLMINDSCCQNSPCHLHRITPVWGLGNQLFVYGSDKKWPLDENDEKKKKNYSPITPVCINEVKWGTDIHCHEFRKLVSESHSIFMDLQREDLESAQSQKTGTLLQYSRRYRSVMKACSMDFNRAIEKLVGGEPADEYQSLSNQLMILETMELIWSLCEIIILEVPPAGILVLKLLDWVKIHSGFVEFLRMVLNGEQSNDTEYWNCIYMCVCTGHIDEARSLLGKRHTRNQDAIQYLDELLRKMPNIQNLASQSLSEFDLRWRHWQQECSACLEDRRLVSSNTEETKHLEKICRILSGDPDVFNELTDILQPWYFALPSILLYQHPTVKSYELEHYSKSLTDGCGDSSLNLDTIISSLLEFDVHQLIKECSTLFSNWWFVAHLTDLLHRGGQLEFKKLDYGSNLREYLLLEYSSSLMSHASLWQVAADYFDQCPEFGRNYLKQYVEKIPLDTEKKAMKMLRLCEKRKMQEQVYGICKVMGMRALHNKRLGSALSWCLRSKDENFATYLSQRFLDEYSEHGSFQHADLIDNLGSAMLLSNRLTFLGKYCEFHKLYDEGEFSEAASLLLSLLTAKLAPRKFWLTLMIDALPMLEAEEVIFSSQQTYELMHCLEEIRLLGRKDLPDDTVKVVSESQKEKLELMRLAMSRNLARAIIQEGTNPV